MSSGGPARLRHPRWRRLRRSSDRKGSIPAAIIAGAAEVGLLGCERDFVAYVAGLIEISREWASLGAVIAVHNSLVCYPIARYRRGVRRDTFLTRLTDKRELGCYAFAEPLAGSDAGAFVRRRLLTAIISSSMARS